MKGNTVLVPLMQHFASYDGADLSTTAFNLIAIQSLPNDLWAKLDAKMGIDWENEGFPANAEVKLGKMFRPSFGVYLDGLIGIGGDRGYDWGVGLGIRFNY